MGKGPIYLKAGQDFSHSADFGFTGSAGKHHVSGYARGGSVEKLSPKGHAKQSRPEGGKVTPNNTWPLTKNNARDTAKVDDMRDKDVNADVTYSAKGGKVKSRHAAQRHMDKMKPIEEHEEYAKGGEAKHWIKGAIKHKGALHRELGVPEGKKIPAKKLAKAAEKGGVEGKRARLAETLGKMHHKTGGVVKKQFAKGGHVTPERAVHKHEGHLHKGEPETKFAKGGHAKHKGHKGGTSAKQAAGALARIASVAEQAQGAGGPPPAPPMPQGMPLRLNPRAGAPMPGPPMPPPGAGPGGPPAMRRGGHAKRSSGGKC